MLMCAIKKLLTHLLWLPHINVGVWAHCTYNMSRKLQSMDLCNMCTEDVLLFVCCLNWVVVYWYFLMQYPHPQSVSVLRHRISWKVSQVFCISNCGDDEFMMSILTVDCWQIIDVHVGEVHYIRNGHQISTLMHVDTTLPLWALFDIYGAVQKVKLLGIVYSFLVVS